MPVPLVMVTTFPAIEHAPVAVMTAVVLALVVADTVKVDKYAAVAGAPVKVTVGVPCATVYVTELGVVALPTASCALIVTVCIPTEPSAGLLSGPVLPVAGMVAEPDGPQSTTPDPPSVQL